ncbi:hypothetical protein GOC14_07095 [Sinorhizobium meliloti]|nr:hypothetical protein [Sinorhizobium meliloti]
MAEVRKPLIAISLGAGVQSTTMALMAAAHKIEPMPDCAIFADTGWEPKAVYQHLEWLTGMLPFPVHIVSAGDIRADAVRKTNTTGQRFASIPWHIRQDDGRSGIGRRQCTKEYKLRPIQRKIVEIVGGRPKAGCSLWIGISFDEAMRMKPSRVQYIVNRFPLLEQRMTRRDCLSWMAKHGYPTPPKSSCIGCPYHSHAHWKTLTKEEIADAIEVDRKIRRQPGMKGEQFMHRSLRPLEEVDLSAPSDRGQTDLFINECEGMCGL